MRVLSLFSGVGAFEKALTNIGTDYELVGFSEIDKWAIESYSAIHNVSTNKNLGDVSEIAAEDIPDADLVTFGFPCQDVSSAGLGAGIEKGTRSGLLYEAERIIDYIKPKYAIAENVKNLIGKRHKKDFDKLLERLDSYGYNSYWTVLNSKDFGIPQNRERVFIVSIRKDIDDGMFEFPTGKDSGIRLKDMLLEEVGDKYYVNNERTKNLLEAIECQVGINVSSQGKVVDGTTEVAHTLLARDYKGFGNQSMTAVAEPNEQKRLGGLYDEADRRRQAGAVWDDKGVSPTLCTMQGGHREPLVIDSETDVDHLIRKLTPQECWRLMGFEDEDYWVARRRLEEKFYNGGDRSNSQMYKQAGNSIVVDVLEAIFKNLFK